MTVWNSPMLSETTVPRRGSSGSELRVLYHGSIVPARVPMTLIDALAITSNRISLVLVGYETIGHPGYVTSLIDHARRLGLADRVHFVGALSREALMNHCATCDVGLCLLPNQASDINQRTMVGASNKAFDYMAVGLALLVPDLHEWRATFVEPGFGLACNPDSSTSIASAVTWMLEHRTERAAMGERGRRRILEEWNYERAFAPVLERILMGAADRKAMHDPSMIVSHLTKDATPDRPTSNMVSR